MMKKSKILININELSEVLEYKKIGYTNFLFAVCEFSIGYSAFALNEIPDDSYVLLNRVMDTKTIDSLKKCKDEFKRFKGIFFEDLGVYNIFKDMGIELIWFQNHFATNYNSINFYLDNGCVSAVISNEITGDEIKKIIAESHKPLVLNVLGKNNIMYSRRKLLSNYNEYMGLDDYNDVTLSTGNDRLFARESEYGTMIFYDEWFNYVDFASELDDEKIKFYLVMNIGLKATEIDKIIEGKSFGNDGFLNKKTVYKLSDY